MKTHPLPHKITVTIQLSVLQLSLSISRPAKKKPQRGAGATGGTAVTKINCTQEKTLGTLPGAATTDVINTTPQKNPKPERNRSSGFVCTA